jgi:DNA-directed RNA polymerase subunit RPC12/RpoP
MRGLIKKMEWRCLLCGEIFELSGFDFKEGDELACPACDSLNIELYSGNI